MPPKQSEPFLLIPSETLLLGHCCQPQIELRFVHKNLSHTLDKLCLSHWACLDMAQATVPRGWPFCSILDTSQAEFQHPSPSLGSSSLLLSLCRNKEMSEGSACLIPHHKPLTNPQTWGSAWLQFHCNVAILLSRVSFSTPRLVIYIFWGVWKRQHLWASPAFSTISACLYFSKQTNQKAW